MTLYQYTVLKSTVSVNKIEILKRSTGLHVYLWAKSY